MFNVTILKAKDLLKSLIIVTIAVVAVMLLGKIKISKSHTEALNVVVPEVLKTEKEQKKIEKNSNQYMKNIISEQIASIGQLENRYAEKIQI